MRIAEQPLSKLALRYSGFEELRKWRLEIDIQIYGKYFRCYVIGYVSPVFIQIGFMFPHHEKHRLAAHSLLSQCSSG